ncbi:MAG: GNAT family N-acetyltransferase [Tepidimonas sp.]|nr:GNAT family N-acetyltransferase [Tepidimonas sp.]
MLSATASDPPPGSARLPAQAAARAPIRTLGPDDRPAILQHLLALGERDRYLRFGFAAQDEHIRRYVEGLRFGLDEVFGIFNRRLQLIAMAHLAYMVRPGQGSDAAEFGVSVSAHARGRGYGQRLFARALLHARNHGVRWLYIHALSENAPMLHIARKAGALVVQQAGESECHLELPPADFDSQCSEMLQEELARVDYRFKALRAWGWRWGRRLLGWTGVRQGY